MESKQFKLSEVVDIISGGTPKRKIDSYWNGDVPWLAIKDFNNDNRKVYKTEEYITEDGLNNSSANLVSPGTVIVSARGTVGATCQVGRDMAFNQSSFGLNAKETLTTNNYIYYWLNYKLNYLKNNVHGSVFDTINRKTFDNLIINLPSIEVQNTITQILTNIDDKIEINQMIIANLEELSQTLFKRWFVDFEFPDENGNPFKSSGGNIVDDELGTRPSLWSSYLLGDFIKLQKGLSYKGKYLDKDKELENSIPLLSLSNFNFYKGFKNEKTKYYFGDFKERHEVNHGDLIIAATDLTQDRKILGSPAIVPKLNEKMIYSLDVFRVSDNKLPIYFLYFLLQTQTYRSRVESSATGTTVVRISQKLLETIELYLPSSMDIIHRFNEIITPYMKNIESLTEESNQLIKLRNTLLPKLMSGEIELPDDLEVEDHAELLQ